MEDKYVILGALLVCCLAVAAKTYFRIKHMKEMQEMMREIELRHQEKYFNATKIQSKENE